MWYKDVKNINWILLLILGLVACRIHSEESRMVITLVTENKHVIIYEGSSKTNICEPIQNARKINIGSLEKAAIFEGEYIIEISTDNETKKYQIQNNFWIYNETDDSYLRCSILSELRGYLLNYLFNKYDENLL
jgi:hypothetical protein